MSALRLDLLRTLSLFQDLAQEELADLAARFEPAAVGEGGVLFAVGEKATALYVLTRGDVTLNVPGEPPMTLRPPAVIGELGGVVGLSRTASAVVSQGAELWQLQASALATWCGARPALGVLLLNKLLAAAAHKVQRDQSRLADMRANLVATQKALKSLRDLVLEAKETPLSAPVHATLDRLIVNNRRVNYRVAPPQSAPAFLRLDVGRAEVVELSRTHITLAWPDLHATAGEGEWMSGVANLAGEELESRARSSVPLMAT